MIAKNIELIFRLIKEKGGQFIWISTKAEASDFDCAKKLSAVKNPTHDHENLDMMLLWNEAEGSHLFLGRYNNGNTGKLVKNKIIRGN